MPAWRGILQGLTVERAAWKGRIIEALTGEGKEASKKGGGPEWTRWNDRVIRVDSGDVKLVTTGSSPENPSFSSQRVHAERDASDKMAKSLSSRFHRVIKAAAKRVTESSREVPGILQRSTPVCQKLTQRYLVGAQAEVHWLDPKAGTLHVLSAMPLDETMREDVEDQVRQWVEDESPSGDDTSDAVSRAFDDVFAVTDGR